MSSQSSVPESLCTTTASEQDTCPQFKSSSWQHDAQPRWPYIDESADGSQRVLTQVSHVSETPCSSMQNANDMLYQLTEIDKKLIRMGYPLKHDIHPAIPAHISLIRYERPQPRYAQDNYNFYSGFFPRGKVPIEIFERDLQILHNAKEKIAKRIAAYIADNPDFNSESCICTLIGRELCVEVPDHWEEIPGEFNQPEECEECTRPYVTLKTVEDLMDANIIAQRAILWYSANHEPVGEEFVQTSLDLLTKKFKLVESIKIEQCKAGEIYYYLRLSPLKA
jgi:hypothetical protein